MKAFLKWCVETAPWRTAGLTTWFMFAFLFTGFGLVSGGSGVIESVGFFVVHSACLLLLLHRAYNVYRFRKAVVADVKVATEPGPNHWYNSDGVWVAAMYNVEGVGTYKWDAKKGEWVLLPKEPNLSRFYEG